MKDKKDKRHWLLGLQYKFYFGQKLYRYAVFPTVHQRMTRIRLCPRAGKIMRIVAGIRMFLDLGKKITRKFIIVLILASKNSFELDKSLPTGWMIMIVLR